MNLTNIPACFTINGKTLTQPERNLLVKLSEIGVPFEQNATLPVEELELSNPMSGVPYSFNNSLVYSLTSFVLDAYRTYDMTGTMSYHGKPVTIQLFDRAKYLVMKLDNAAYSYLID